MQRSQAAVHVCACVHVGMGVCACGLPGALLWKSLTFLLQLKPATRWKPTFRQPSLRSLPITQCGWASQKPQEPMVLPSSHCQDPLFWGCWPSHLSWLGSLRLPLAPRTARRIRCMVKGEAPLRFCPSGISALHAPGPWEGWAPSFLLLGSRVWTCQSSSSNTTGSV